MSYFHFYKLFLFFYYFLLMKTVEADICGPEGYNAKDLLLPNYWYIDLIGNGCPPIPSSRFTNFTVNENTTCRIYFNVCHDLKYQCSGTVCARYLQTQDYVSLLGKYYSHPFTEGRDSFLVSYEGEHLPCTTGDLPVKTELVFKCDNTTWDTTVTNAHGGALAPMPHVEFDVKFCKYSLIFNSSEACFTVAPNDVESSPISNGSFILILVIPAFLLYFVLGVLFNCSRGKTGKDMIPHRKFWMELPDLIMDGFAFTMATLTCRTEDRYPQNYDELPE